MLNSQTSFEIQVTENYNKHNIHLICYLILRLVSSRSNTHSAFSSLFTEIFRCQLFYYYYFFYLFYFFISSWWWMRCMMGQNENCAMDSGSCSVLLTNVKVKDFSFKKLIPLFSFCVIWYEAISQFFISIQNYKRNWCPQGINEDNSPYPNAKLISNYKHDLHNYNSQFNLCNWLSNSAL